MSELGRAEDNGYLTLENMTKYFITRGKLVSKVAALSITPLVQQCAHVLCATTFGIKECSAL